MRKKGGFRPTSGTRQAKSGFRCGIVSRESGGKESKIGVFLPFFQLLFNAVRVYSGGAGSSNSQFGIVSALCEAISPPKQGIAYPTGMLRDRREEHPPRNDSFKLRSACTARYAVGGRAPPRTCACLRQYRRYRCGPVQAMTAFKLRIAGCTCSSSQWDALTDF